MVKEFYITIQGWSGRKGSGTIQQTKGEAEKLGGGGGASAGRELGEQGHRPPKMQSVCY